MGFYSVSPLTPGGWSSLLDDRGLPHNLRRLPVTIVAAGGERVVDTRCLPMLPALAYLLAEPEEHQDGEQASDVASRSDVNGRVITPGT